MPMRPEIERTIAEHPACDMRNEWRLDTVGDTTRLFIEREPRVAAITPEETMRLMNLLISKTEEHYRNGFKLANGVEISATPREIQVDRNRWRSSAVIPGLFLDEDMPMDETAGEMAVAEINAFLAAAGHPASALRAKTPNTSYERAFHGTYIVVATPESKGEYELYSNYTHRPLADRRMQSQRLARHIGMRIKHKATVLRMRKEAEAKAKEIVAGVEGMRVTGSHFTLEGWKMDKDGVFAGDAYAEVEMLGDNLKPKTVSVSVKNADQIAHVKRHIGQHRKRLKLLADKEPDQALMCEPILANALRALDPKFIPDILGEIEKAVTDRGAHPNNPRLRGIANITVREGLLTAPVAIGKGGRFIKERVNVKSIKQLPAAVLLSMPGRIMTDLVDHPLLAGLVIKSVTINTYGLQLRPEPAPVPLAEVLDDLRARLPEDKR